MATPNLLGLTSVTPRVLVSTQITVVTDSVVYTVPANSAVKLTGGTICNTSSSPVTIGLSIIPSGGAADATHKVIADTFSLGAGDTLPLRDYLDGMMLGDGDAVAAHAGTASVLDIVLTGLVMA